MNKKKLIAVVIAFMVMVVMAECEKASEKPDMNDNANSGVKVADNGGMAKTQKKGEEKPTESSEEDTEAGAEDNIVLSEKGDDYKAEQVSFTDSGTITRLIEVANDPNAGSTTDQGVTYMFTNDDQGKRILGTVMAYY